MRWILAACLFAALPSWAADTPPSVEITLEQYLSGEWKPVDPRTVFRANDQIRFRFQSTTGGYLYVLNRSSNGESEWIFPNVKTGRANEVEPGKAYLVPATEGAFVIEGTPGFDITYWLINPTPLADWENSLEQAAPQKVENTLLPRCREGGLKARGDGGCLDDRAGAGPVKNTSALPAALGRADGLQPRGLRFHGKGSTSTTITAKGPAGTPLLYEFRVAHQ